MVYTDLVGPLPKAKGGVEYLLTSIDLATRLPEAILLKSMTLQVVINRLREMFARQGVHGVLVSDNGPQFTSKRFKDFYKSEGMKHVTSAPYCPQSNGVVERFHRTLKEMLTNIVDKKGNWPEIVSDSQDWLPMLRQGSLHTC